MTRRHLLPLAAAIVAALAAAQDVQSQDQPAPLPSSRSEDLAESARGSDQLEQKLRKAVEDHQTLRMKFIGNRVDAYRFAQYAEDWKNKIERVGNLNYPEAARGTLYGTIVATVEIASDGAVRSVEINRSSGHRVLDDAVKRIVMMASPFAPFPPEIRRDTDVIVITRTWTFANTFANTSANAANEQPVRDEKSTPLQGQ